MSISGLSTDQAAALGLINGTGATQTQSANAALAQGQSATQAQTASDTLDLGAGTQTLASPAAMSMSQLQNLAKSDPTRFKAVTQNISELLSGAAQNNANPQQGKFLEGLSEKFADASKSGSMSALDFQKGHHHHHSGSASSALGKYSGQEGSALSGVFSQVGSIISSALSSAGVSSSAAPAAASSAVAGVAASGETAA
jgi:hypothetical protein